MIGGAGFIGSHLCDALIRTGDHVICVDNLMRGAMQNIENLVPALNFSFINADAGNNDEMCRIMHDYCIEYVYHLAANSDIQASAGDPQIEYKHTMSTTWSLLQAMRKNGIKKMFFASTSAVYGEKCNEALTEDSTVLAPISYYGAAKMASEAYIHAFAHMNDMDVLVFRFPNVVGSRLTHGVIFDFINRLKIDSSVLHVLGNGTQTKPYMHVSDLVDGIVAFRHTAKGILLYNIGVTTETSVKHIAEMVCGQMGLSTSIIMYGQSNVGWKGDVPRFSYSLDKLFQAGWQPKHTSDEAVLLTIKEVLNIM